MVRLSAVFAGAAGSPEHVAHEQAPMRAVASVVEKEEEGIEPEADIVAAREVATVGRVHPGAEEAQ
jgi:hypothetical protein